jgi:hypothetical protein
MEYDSRVFIWFMLIFNVIVITISVFNVINFDKVLKDDNDDNIGLSRGYVRALYWLNIALAAVSGYIFLYTIVKAIFGKERIEKVANLIPEYFTKKATSIYNGAKQLGATSIEATEAAALDATNDAIKQGKNLTEAIMIGTTAGTQAGVFAGFDKGDAEVIAKRGADKAVDMKLSKYIKKLN